MAKVAAGFFSFTEITDPGAHLAYNEWHQLDHLPSQYPLPGIVYGQRWALTEGCRTRRLVAEAPLNRADYVTLYLMAEPLAETLRDFSDLARELRAVGRFFDERRAVLSGPFDVGGSAAARRVLISAEAIPYRPTRGIYVLVEAVPASGDESSGAARPALAELPGVAGVWQFRPLARTLPSDLAGRWRPGRHRITVWFLDGDPASVAEDVGDAARSLWSDAGTVPLLASPFAAILPWQWKE